MSPVPRLVALFLSAGILTAAHAADERLNAASADVRQAVQHIADRRDNQAMPFAIVDKKAARVFVFAADGTLRGSSPVLLGLAHGDDSVPGIGDRPMAAIKPEERTTPAGRFVSEPGMNTGGEDIVWVDYDAAVSMHRVRASDPRQRRLERLASATVEDNRISYGCINVPRAFYDAHVHPLLGRGRGVVYVLPETRPVSTLFSAAQARAGS